MLFSLAIGGIALAALAMFTLGTGRSLAGIWNYVELEAQTTHALDSMIRDVRMASYLTGFSTNCLVFADANPAQSLIFEYSPNQRSLLRVKSGVTNTLLTGCDALTFSIYQRNSLSDSFDQYPTSLSASNCKVVQVNWTCSRSITGTKLNTEMVQTAKIVIRNQ